MFQFKKFSKTRTEFRANYINATLIELGRISIYLCDCTKISRYHLKSRQKELHLEKLNPATILLYFQLMQRP